MAALVIVVSENSDDRNPDVFKHSQACMHLLRLAVIGQIPRNHDCVSKLIHPRKIADVLLMVFRAQMDVGNCCEPHPSLRVSSSTRNKRGRRSPYSWNRSRSPHSFTSMANILGSIREPRKG